LAARADALVPHLFDALARRYPIHGRIDPELTPPQRLAVAATSIRPSRTRWVEQFYKSHHGYQLRTANATRQLTGLSQPSQLGQPGQLGQPSAATHPVFQVHALFEVTGAPSVLYVDCTHAQSAAQWPAWNPLRGKALERWYRREAQAYRNAVHIFAFSWQTRDSLLHDYGVSPARISVVGAGVNLRSLPPLRSLMPGPDPGVPTVLFIGNDFARKGGPTLLRAFRRVREQLPSARLQLVGTEPGITPEPGVDVLGRIHNRAMVAQLYRQASVFCLPSFFDPFPLVLLEAMAHSVPVVTTSSCGIPDMIRDGHTGRLVPAGDPTAIADALLGLLSNPLRARLLGATGRQHVAGHYTWDHVVDRMAPVLDRLVSA
jgi:glycosyltransferase involved in cell wall biosynthesis